MRGGREPPQCVGAARSRQGALCPSPVAANCGFRCRLFRGSRPSGSHPCYPAAERARAAPELDTAAMETATAQPTYLDQSAFQYDYESLRTTGVILAVVMFVSGILIALSKKIKCSKSSSSSSPIEDPQASKTEVPSQTV
ncbi:FXYD domain-containing ion transport regulator 7-like isoform X2 [Arapaima gigas]